MERSEYGVSFFPSLSLFYIVARLGYWSGLDGMGWYRMDWLGGWMVWGIAKAFLVCLFLGAIIREGSSATMLH